MQENLRISTSNFKAKIVSDLQYVLFYSIHMEQDYIKLFIHSLTQLLFSWEGRKGSSPRRTRNSSRFSTISDSSAGSTSSGTKQGGRCSHTTCSLDDLVVGRFLVGVARAYERRLQQVHCSGDRQLQRGPRLKNHLSVCY